jgi:hypothetical protein
MSDFIPYQVDYSVQNISKTLGFSKKRVTFRFGFADRKALAEGKLGPACRGSEHELVYVWSLSSGKRQIMVDNKDVHFSESGQNGWTSDREFQHSFTLRDRTGGTHRLQFISQPASRDMVHARPFDLTISGMSYFYFNKIYQLGTPQMVVGATQRNYGRESPMTAEERKQIALAKLESLKELAHQEEAQVQKFVTAVEQLKEKSPSPAAPAAAEEELIRFDEDPIPPHIPPAVPAAFSMSSQGLGTSSLTLDASFDDPQQQQYDASRRSLYGNNPYAVPPPASYNPSATYPPYGGATNPMYGTNPYATPSAPTVAETSNALTPYYAPGAPHQPQPQQQAYVDSTGRLSIGQPPPPTTTTTSNYFPDYSVGGTNVDYSNASTYNTTTAAASTTVTTNPLTSPTGSQYSYGSAPSFAQPPSYNSNSYAAAPATTYSAYNSGYPASSQVQPSDQPTSTTNLPPMYPAYNYNNY